MKKEVISATVEGLHARWVAQYPDSKLDISAALKALNPSATIEEAEAIIGNQSWTRVWCHECGEYGDAVVRFGEGYESLTVCGKCLKKALALLKVRTASDRVEAK